MSEPNAVVPALEYRPSTPTLREGGGHGYGAPFAPANVDNSTHVFSGARDFHISGGHIIGTVINNYHALPPTAEDHLNKVLELIPGSDHRAIQAVNMGKRTPGTGESFMKQELMQDFLKGKSKHRMMWGMGGPGRGKTLKAARFNKELEGMERVNPKIAVAYAYLRYDKKLSLVDILTALIREQVERHPKLAPIVEPLFTQKQREERDLTVEELVTLLKQMASYFDQTFFSIDGLDEAPREMHVDIVHTISRIEKANLFMTSRPLDNVKEVLTDVHLFDITTEDLDVELFIKDELRKNVDLNKLVDGFGRDAFIERVQRNADGMFLHAALQMGALRNAITVDGLQRQLERTPRGADAMYRSTIQRIKELPDDQRDIAMRALFWLVFGPSTKEPLGIKDLLCALTFDEETETFNSGEAIEESTLLSLCCGLITVESKHSMYTGDRQVRLVHYTAKEHLQDILAVELAKSPHLILRTCIARLKEFDFQTYSGSMECSSSLRQQPLLYHSYFGWAECTRTINEGDADAMTIVLDFLSQCTAFPLSFPTTWDPRPDSGGLLHFAATFELSTLLQRLAQGYPKHNSHLINAAVNSTTVKKLKTPLMITCDNRDLASMRILLAIPETDVNACPDGRSAPLRRAAEGGYTEVVQLLLARPDVKANCVGLDGKSALMRAAEGGYTEVVQLLLARPKVKADRVDSVGQSALLWAAQMGKTEVVQLLLARPEEKADRVDSFGNSALMRAAEAGYAEVVQLLLARPDVKADRVDSFGRSALLCAARTGYTEVVQLLLARPDVEADRVDSDGKSALMRAAEAGYAEVVQLLLARPDVKADRVGSDGKSALMRAAQMGTTEVVQLLLARPDVEADRVDPVGQSALLWAAMVGRTEVVELLLAHPDVKADRVDSHGQSALQLATDGDYRVVARLIAYHMFKCSLTPRYIDPFEFASPPVTDFYEWADSFHSTSPQPAYSPRDTTEQLQLPLDSEPDIVIVPPFVAPPAQRQRKSRWRKFMKLLGFR